MRKHLSKIFLLTAALCLLLAGCGQSGQNAETLPENSTEQSEQAEQPAQAPTGEAEGDEPAAPEETPEPDEQTYTDNFSVDQAAAEAFAQKIQAVVADKDMEGLADLMMFPNYVGFPEDAQFVETREDFLALDPSQVFAEDLLTEVSSADISSLEPSQAGFVLSASGRPNIVFGVAEGSLAIVGINY